MHAPGLLKNGVPSAVGHELITGVVKDVCRKLRTRRVQTNGHHPHSSGTAKAVNSRLLMGAPLLGE